MKTLFAALHTAYFYVALAIDTAILALTYTPLSRKKHTLTPDAYMSLITQRVHNWGTRQLRNTGVRIDVIGSEHIPTDQAVLYVANHQSYFDLGLFFTRIPQNKGYIAKIEAKKIPLISDYMDDLRCIYLDRGNLRQNMQTILDGIAILKEGHSLVIFPEGTRNNEMESFKAGSFKLATKSGVPIIPVTIDGAYKILPKGQKLINARQQVTMTIHPPVPTTGLTKEAEKELPQQIEDIVRSGFKRSEDREQTNSN